MRMSNLSKYRSFATEGTDEGGGGGGGTTAKFELPENWRDSLPDDLKNEPSLKTFNSIEALSKSFVHAQKAMGSDKVVKPNKLFADNDWKDFYKNIGVPQSEKDFVIEKPEDIKGVDEKFMEVLKKASVKANMFPAQAKALLTEVMPYLEKTKTDVMNADKVKREEALTAFKKEQGEAFDNTVAKAQLAYKTFGDEAIQKLLTETGLGNDPGMIKMFAKAADLLKEGKLKGDPTLNSDVLAPAEALKAWTDFTSTNQAYKDGRHPNHAAAILESERLAKMAWPDPKEE